MICFGGSVSVLGSGIVRIVDAAFNAAAASMFTVVE
jgi:hypothetical protein